MPSQRKEGIDYAALSDFRYEIRRFLNFSERAARQAGIEPHQHQALLVVKGSRPGQNATVGSLAERLQVQHHSAVELVNRLEGKRLISRQRSRADRRQMLLSLTARGERLLNLLTVSHRDELQIAAPKLLRALRGAIGGASGSREIKYGPPHAPGTKRRSGVRAQKGVPC